MMDMTDAVLPVKVFEGSWEHTFVTGGVAALAGLMFGLDIGVISGALQALSALVCFPSGSAARCR
jgi:hypothetical protein